MDLTRAAELFLECDYKYDYAEAKDLCKQFLTVVTTVLVISPTFSEKVPVFATASRAIPVALDASWRCMLVAIILGGTSLAFDAEAGGQAAYLDPRFPATARGAYALALGAGVLFASGMASPIAAAGTSPWRRDGGVAR